MDETLKQLLGVAADRAEEIGHWLAPFIREMAGGVNAEVRILSSEEFHSGTTHIHAECVPRLQRPEVSVPVPRQILQAASSRETEVAMEILRCTMHAIEQLGLPRPPCVLRRDGEVWTVKG